MKRARHPRSSQNQNPKDADAAEAVERFENTLALDSKERQEKYGSTETEFDVCTMWKLAHVGSSQPDRVNERYMIATYESFKPRNRIESLLATHAAVANGLAMQQAAMLSHADVLPAAEFAQRAYVELSRLFVEHVQSFNKIQNTQNNNINIQTLSVENGSQANIGCMTNESAINPAEPQAKKSEPE